MNQIFKIKKSVRKVTSDIRSCIRQNIRNRYGKDALFVISLINLSLIFGLVWVYYSYGFELFLGFLLIFVCIILLLQRKWFLSPCSLQIQERISSYILMASILKERDKRRLLRDFLEIHHEFGGIFALISGALLSAIAFGVNQLYNISLQGFNGVEGTLWIVHATVTGFSFIVLIFFWEYLGDEYDGNSTIIRTAIRYTWSLHIIYFLLGANIVIGFSALVVKYGAGGQYILIQLLFYLISIYGIYRLYHTVYYTMVEDTLKQRVRKRIRYQTRQMLLQNESPVWRKVIDSHLELKFPQIHYPSFGGDQERFTAEEVGITGKITDINIHRLRNFVEYASGLDVDVKSLPVYRQEYDEDEDVLVIQGDINDQEAENLIDLLTRAVKVQ